MKLGFRKGLARACRLVLFVLAIVLTGAARLACWVVAVIPVIALILIPLMAFMWFLRYFTGG